MVEVESTYVRPGENLRKPVVVIALLAALALIAAPSASASGGSGSDRDSIVDAVTGLLPSATTDSCQDPLIENPFSFAGDLLDYVLAPDGSFEGSASSSWLLDGGAAAVPGNDPFPIRPAAPDATVMSLPTGSSATSAPMCVDLTYPTFRLAVHALPRADGKYKGRLKIETLYPNAKNPQWRKVDVIKPDSGAWTLSDFLDLQPERGGSTPGARQVSLRFSVTGEGGFEIDDVYVDPRMRI
jgi:hypothetical protein